MTESDERRGRPGSGGITVLPRRPQNPITARVPFDTDSGRGRDGGAS